MARGYGDVAAWEPQKKAPEALSSGTHEMTSATSKPKKQMPCEVASGAVQSCALEAANPHEHYDTLIGSSLSDYLPPKITIPPIPNRLRMHIPPSNFGAVEEGSIYRSGYPQPKNYSFLESLNLKTILTLVPETISPEYAEFIKSHHIRHIQIHIPANKDGKVNITPERIVLALSAVLDRANHPLLIHCNRGKHRTGCVTACLRKVQNATTEHAVAEYRDYSHPKCRDGDMDFIRSFDPQALLPFARKKGWPVTPPPEKMVRADSDGEGLQMGEKKDSFVFTLEDIAACKVPEEPDHSL